MLELFLECIASISKNISTSIPPKIIERPSLTQPQNKFAESPWYNHVVLHELDILGEDATFLKSLFDNFQLEGDKHILAIRKSIKEDYLLYRENLHALKGSATELGATKLAKACIDGEALKPYDLGSEKIKLACQSVEQAYHHTIDALATVIRIENTAPLPKAADH